MGNKVHKPFYLPAVFFGMFLLISGAAGDDYAPNLVYDELLDTYIRQLVGKHSLNLPPEYWIKPMTASVVMKFLHKADSLRQKGDLSKQEALMLDRLKKHASGESKLFSWYHEKQKTQVHLGLSLIGDISPFLSDSEAEFRGRGILRPNLPALSAISAITPRLMFGLRHEVIRCSDRPCISRMRGLRIISMEEPTAVTSDHRIF
ncbi:MAG: hypothetical protein ACOC4C_00190 [Fibrobacterota bacterium]